MASIRKRPDRPKPWEAVWRDPDGRQRTRSFTRKVDAQRFLTSVEADKLRGRYVDPSAGKITCRAFAEQWARSQTVNASTREGTDSHLRAHLLPTFGDLELRAIRPSSVQQWLASASRTLAPGYVRVLLATLSAIISAAVEDGLIASNPCVARGPCRHLRCHQGASSPWTVEQVQAVIAALPHRYRATAAVAAGCGLRQGETFGLRVADVDFLRRRLQVRQQVKQVKGQGVVIAPPKRGKTREVPLPDVVAVAVAEHLRAYPSDGLVFANTAGRPINRRSFNARTWRPAVVSAGLEPTRGNGFHALRHHYASVLLDGGVSIRALADYLGHTDPGFTLRVYTHLMPASEDRARQAVDTAFSREPGVSQARP